MYRMDTIKSKSQIPHVTAFALFCAFFPLSMHYMGGLSVTEGIKLGASKYDFQSKLITVNHKHDLKTSATSFFFIRMGFYQYDDVRATKRHRIGCTDGGF